jgi:hypothetical protein
MAIKWRGNGAMARKWRDNGEKMTQWIVDKAG